MITTQEHLTNLIFNAYHREKEIYAYQVNIDNYQSMLQLLPVGDIPDALSQYKNVGIAELPFDLSDEDVDLISQYQHKDRLRVLIRTEKSEQTKSKLILETLKNQVASNGGDYVALLSEFKAAEDAKIVTA